MKALPVSQRSHTNIPSGSTAPVSENGSKKQWQEVEAEDMNLHPGVMKKMCQEMVSAQGSQPCDSPPHLGSSSVQFRNGAKFDTFHLKCSLLSLSFPNAERTKIPTGCRGYVCSRAINTKTLMYVLGAFESMAASSTDVCIVDVMVCDLYEVPWPVPASLAIPIIRWLQSPANLQPPPPFH
jgi:hypothetical protein